MTPIPSPAERRKLVYATGAAAALAALVLITAVLPAEYGVDPTGIGRLTGFARLSDAAGPPIAVTEDDGVRTTHAIDAAWRVQTIAVATQSGFTESNHGETRVNLPLKITNLSSITATLEWNDTDIIDGQRTEPDLFELSIRGPGGRESQVVQADNGPDGRGNITVSLPWRSIPTPERTDKGLLLPVHEADNSSHGNWTFTVRLYTARGLPDHAEEDPGNHWTLSIEAETFELNLKESDGFSGDRVSLTLRPDQGVEYKFHMQPAATLSYRWTSSAPVHWDLHAEEDGKAPEDFTRFKEGTGTAESGTVTATFSGRHGWFFLNRGDAPITVTLETSGDYTILGVV